VPPVPPVPPAPPALLEELVPVGSPGFSPAQPADKSQRPVITRGKIEARPVRI